MARRGWAPSRRCNVRVRRGGNGSRPPPTRAGSDRGERVRASSAGFARAILSFGGGFGGAVEVGVTHAPSVEDPGALGRVLDRAVLGAELDDGHGPLGADAGELHELQA